MTTTTPTLQWSESESPAEIRTGEQLDQLLDRLTATARPEFPISVRLQAHDCEADILLGLAESFVYLNEVSPTRYYITVGDSYVDGIVSFHLLGQHHTEFERRHLIPTATARRVLREFFDTGRRPMSVEWEEGSY
jgi:hypothetical protein